MKISQVLNTYDKSYAAEYDETFLLSDWVKNSIAFQLKELKGCLQNANNWLDVACGTGFFLSHFPEVSRAGLDISPSMLELAGEHNPSVPFFLGNLLDER